MMLNSFSLTFREDTRVVNSKNHAPRLIPELGELPRLYFAPEDFENFAILFFGFCNQAARAHAKSS